MTTRGQRGQSEVGTLIVFIAVILIVGTVAGVMFDVTGSLAGTTAHTGQQSNQKVVDRLEFLATTGTIGSADRVHAIEFIVRQSAGTDAINLSSVTVEFLGPDGVDRLSPTVDGDGSVSITDLQDDDSSLAAPHPILNDRADRARLNLSLRTVAAEGGTNGPMEPGETARVRFGLASGGANVVRIRIPPSLPDGSSVQL